MIPLNEYSVDQIGIVVENLSRFISQFKLFFGTGEIKIINWPVEGIDPHSMLFGQPEKWKMKLGFIKYGNISLEIIEPVEGDSIFKRHLEEHGPGLHHIRFSVDDIEKSSKLFIESGYSQIANGDGVHKGSKWAFFDTSSDFEGLIVELRTRLDPKSENDGWLK